MPKLILEYREVQKLKSTYVEVLPAGQPRHRPDPHQLQPDRRGDRTAELVGTEPAEHPRPHPARRGDPQGLHPRPRSLLRGGGLLPDRTSADGAPLRGSRVHSGLPGGRRHPSPDRVDHLRGAGRAGDGRNAGRAKTINFGTIYGQGPFALSRQLGITQEEAKAFITQYFERFAGVRAYLDLQVRLAREQGYVETLFGRRRYIPEIKEKNFNVRAFAERTAQNTPLQGSAADLIKIAMMRIHRALREGLRRPAAAPGARRAGAGSADR